MVNQGRQSAPQTYIQHGNYLHGNRKCTIKYEIIWYRIKILPKLEDL